MTKLLVVLVVVPPKDSETESRATLWDAARRKSRHAIQCLGMRASLRVCTCSEFASKSCPSQVPVPVSSFSLPGPQATLPCTSALLTGSSLRSRAPEFVLLGTAVRLRASFGLAQHAPVLLDQALTSAFTAVAAFFWLWHTVGCMRMGLAGSSILPTFHWQYCIKLQNPFPCVLCMPHPLRAR